MDRHDPRSDSHVRGLLLAVLLAPGLLVAAVFLAAALFDRSFAPAFLSRSQNLALTAVFITDAAVYLALTPCLFYRGFRAVQQERCHNTWDLLRLTHLSAAQVLLSKGWIVFRDAGAVLLCAVILHVGSTLVALLMITTQARTAYSLIMLLLIETTLFTLLDFALSVALGLSAALLDQPNRLALISLIGLRLIATLASIVLEGIGLVLFSAVPGSIVLTFLGGLALAGLIYSSLVWSSGGDSI